eukprot:358751-Chlamydomonas_euryale.AAC.2
MQASVLVGAEATMVVLLARVKSNQTAWYSIHTASQPSHHHSSLVYHDSDIGVHATCKGHFATHHQEQSCRAWPDCYTASSTTVASASKLSSSSARHTISISG